MLTKLSVLMIALLVSGCGLMNLPGMSDNIRTQMGQPTTVNNPNCSKPVDVFVKTVWPLSVSKCAACHAAGGGRILFAAGDTNTAYVAALGVMEPDSTRMSSKSGDGHCGAGCSDAAPFRKAISDYLAGVDALAIQTGCGTSPTPLPAAGSVPVAPSGLLAAAVSANQINLSWTDNSDDEDGFSIQRSTDSIHYADAGTTAGGVNSYASIGLTASTQYYYRVAARNSAGDSSYSAVAFATTQAPAVTVPAAPTAPAAVAISSSQINVTWTDHSNNESGFRIQRSTDNASWTEAGTVGANLQTYGSTALTANMRYYYRVQSYNAAGTSAYTSPVNAVTLTAGPNSNAGNIVYDNRCAGCHRLGTYDTSGGDGNLSGRENSVDNKYPNAGQSGHKGIVLSATEIADLKAFITIY